MGGSLQLWSIPGGELRQTLTWESRDPRARSLSFSPDGSTVVSTDRNSSLIWDLSAGTSRQANIRHAAAITAISFHPGGSPVATGSREVHLWDPGTGDLARTIDVGKQGVLSLAFSPDGSKLVIGSEKLPLQIWGTGERSRPAR
jgi:WD40 repeat protein